ncbi:ABC transporter permease [Halorarum halophilum]|uniref:ABC transporter permease n=1 Tax=Halorarum halophilum TaxID=2743090 RepID=A0A7D5GM42_9EURY|nr:ABC transporter permease subunit [Halobaculum halophilum]QLG28404.1 ABC transporter permease [Halobaculum halophilum]
MSLEAVTRKDFEDAVRSRWLLALSAFFVLLVSGVAYIVRPGGGGTFSSNAILGLVNGSLVTTLVPLIALVIAYGAVVGERESGSLKLLLSLPHSRAEVVFGKVLGRTGAMAVPIVIGFLLPALVLAVGPLQFDAGSYIGYTLLVVFLAAVFVAIAVGFSAAVPSQRLAVAGAVAVYFVFVPLWQILQLPLQFFLLGGTPGWLPLTGNEVLRLVRLVNPTGSFKIVSGEYLAGTLLAAGEAGSDAAGQWATNMEIAAVAMLIAWLLVPPLLGLWRFEQADL